MIRPTVKLVMIVKDESAVLERCIGSLRGLVDSILIVDTGSTDATEAVAREAADMINVPLLFLRDVWDDFASNRNRALEHGREQVVFDHLDGGAAPWDTYLLMIDADEQILTQEKPNDWPVAWPRPKWPAEFDGSKDAYSIDTWYGGLCYPRIQLTRANHPFRFGEMPVHEVLEPLTGATYGTLAGLCNLPMPDGARSRDPDKFTKDAAMLEGYCEKHPADARAWYHLAQSYRDAHQWDRAHHRYATATHIFRQLAKRANTRERRAYCENYAFSSILEAAKCLQHKGEDPRPLLQALRTLAPEPRAEPLWHEANWYRLQGEEPPAELLEHWKAIPLPSKGALFVETWAYHTPQVAP